MQEIRSIQIVNQQNNGKLYEVGKSLSIEGLKKTGKYEITKIIDDFKEYYDSADRIYSVYAKSETGNTVLLARIENCSVLIEYY